MMAMLGVRTRVPKMIQEKSDWEPADLQKENSGTPYAHCRSKFLVERFLGSAKRRGVCLVREPLLPLALDQLSFLDVSRSRASNGSALELRRRERLQPFALYRSSCLLVFRKRFADRLPTSVVQKALRRTRPKPSSEQFKETCFCKTLNATVYQRSIPTSRLRVKRSSENARIYL